VKRLLLLAGAAALCLAATDWRDWRDWRYEEHETIKHTFSTSGSDPKKLLVDNISGYIHVTGYNGSEVRVTVERQAHAESKSALSDAKQEVKLDMDQRGNAVRLYEDGPFRSNNGTNYRGDHYYGYHVNYDYDIEVPTDTVVWLKTINNGRIEVRKTTGDFDVEGLNGGIEMDDVGGSGIVKTLNGSVRVAFSRNPVHDSSFDTLNGSIDVYFQPGLDADIRFQTLHGGVYTDFDVAPLTLEASSSSGSGGRYIYHSDGRMRVRAGKGGPELSFHGLNGPIRLHSKAF
jgi:hypothetical protein